MDRTAKPLSGEAAFQNGEPGLITVQPPRREDLQPSYAKNIQGDIDDTAAHGWYGGMSMTVRHKSIITYAD